MDRNNILYAAAKGNSAKLTLFSLLDFRQTANAATSHGSSIAHLAARQGNFFSFMVVRFLHKGLLEKRNDNGLSPADYAAFGGHTGILKAIFRTNRRYLSLRDKNGDGIVHHLVRDYSARVIKMLRDTTKNSTQLYDDVRPLRLQFQRVVEFLELIKPDLLQETNNEGKRPLDLAKDLSVRDFHSFGAKADIFDWLWHFYETKGYLGPNRSHEKRVESPLLSLHPKGT